MGVVGWRWGWVPAPVLDFALPMMMIDALSPPDNSFH
jgi:hypothetical protein